MTALSNIARTVGLAIALSYAVQYGQAQLPQPTRISFTLIQARLVGVAVRIPVANGANVRVEFILNGRVSKQQNIPVTSGSALVVFSGLRPATTYTVRASAVEGNTRGPTLEAIVTTRAQAPSGPVKDLTATDTSSRAVTLTWQPPEERHINSADGLTGYHVQLRTSERSQCTNEPLQTVNTTATTQIATFSSLKPASSYCVIVFAINKNGMTLAHLASSGRYTFTTAEEAPSNSPTFTLVQPQFTQLSVAWREPTQSNGVLTQYIIQYRQQGSSSGWTSTTHSALSNTKIFVNSEFTPGASYELRIAARNAIGRGSFSSPVQFIMRPPILDICVCRLDNGSAKFVWTVAPGLSLGADLEQLKFTLSSGEETLEHTVDNATSGSVFTGLKDREYSLQVELVWIEEKQLFFSTDTKDLGNLQTEPNCFPAKPRGLVAPAQSIGAKSFSLSWSAPSTTNGPVLKYIITVESNDSKLPYSMTFEGESTSLSVDGLEEAVQCLVWVRAVNKFGEGPNVELSITTDEAAPSGPAQNITVVTNSTTAVLARWENPQYRDINSVGGITGYKVVIGNRCSDTLKYFETAELCLTFDGLEPGRNYCVRVFPINRIGMASDDAVSNSAVTVELSDVLPAPKPVGMTIATTHAVLVWKKVESMDELNPVTGYLITVPLSEASGVNRSSAVYFNVTGLAPGKAYSVEVAAENAIGAGRTLQFSFNTTAIAEPARTPQVTSTCPPTTDSTSKVPNTTVDDIRLERISNNVLKVQWDDPENQMINSMGGIITGYAVVIGNGTCDNEVQTWTVQKNVRSVTFESLTPNQKYCVRVHPANNYGLALERTVQESDKYIDFPNLIKCTLEKGDPPSFLYGEAGLTFLCKPQWSLNKCRLSPPTPGLQCVPTSSRLTALTFRCLQGGTEGGRKLKMDMEVAKDTGCHTIQTAGSGLTLV